MGNGLFFGICIYIYIYVACWVGLRDRVSTRGGDGFLLFVTNKGTGIVME